MLRELKCLRVHQCTLKCTKKHRNVNIFSKNLTFHFLHFSAQLVQIRTPRCTEVFKWKCHEHRRNICANVYVLKRSHTSPQAAAGLVAAGRILGNQAPLSARALASRLHRPCQIYSGPIGPGPLRRARDDSIWLAPVAEHSLSRRGVRSPGHAWKWEQALLHQFVGHDMVVRPNSHRAGWWVSALLCIFDIRPKILCTPVYFFMVLCTLISG